MMVISPSTSRSRAAVARRAHNPKVGGSIPPFATKTPAGHRPGFFYLYGATVDALPGSKSLARPGALAPVGSAIRRWERHQPRKELAGRKESCQGKRYLN